MKSITLKRKIFLLLAAFLCLALIVPSASAQRCELEQIEYEHSYPVHGKVGPRNVTVVRRSPTQMYVFWEPPIGGNADDVAYYEIYRYDNSGGDLVRFKRNKTTTILLDKAAPLRRGEEEVDYIYYARVRFAGSEPSYSTFSEPIFRKTGFQP